MKEINAIIELEKIQERIRVLHQLIGGHKINYEVEIRELIESSKMEETRIKNKLSEYYA